MGLPSARHANLPPRPPDPMGQVARSREMGDGLKGRGRGDWIRGHGGGRGWGDGAFGAPRGRGMGGGHGGHSEGQSPPGMTIRVQGEGSAPTLGEWASSMPGPAVPSRPESAAASMPAPAAPRDGQLWWPEYRPLAHSNWASDSLPSSRAPSRPASAMHARAPFGETNDPRTASPMPFSHSRPASAAPSIEPMEWGPLEGFGTLSIHEPFAPTPLFQQPHRQAHPLPPPPQFSRSSLVAHSVSPTPQTYGTHDTPGSYSRPAPDMVRKPISLQISASQAPPTPPSTQAPPGSLMHSPSPRGAPYHRGSPSPRGRRRGAYGGDTFHPLPDHHYRRNYGYVPGFNRGDPGPRGRGRGRGRGKLWVSRDNLTPEALSSVQDESFAATGSLGAWATKTRPLSPPREGLESGYDGAGVPPSMPPTPWASPRRGSPPVRQPAPGAKLDSLAFPHIFEAVFAVTPYAGLLNLRRVSRGIKERVDERLFRHVLLCTPERASGLALLSPEGQRLPFLPWDLDPVPAPEHRDSDDIIEELYGPLDDDVVDDTAAINVRYFSRMSQLRHVRTLDFYSTKSRLKPISLGLKDVAVIRSRPDFHWETHPRKWRIQAPTFVSYLDLVQSWEDGGWGVVAEEDPFFFLIPRATREAVIHMHYDCDKRVIPTRFRTLPDLRELTVVWHNSAFGQGDADALLPAITGLPANLRLTLVGLEPVNLLMAGNWARSVYAKLDELGVPNFRAVRVLSLAAWEAGRDELITQDYLDPRIQPYVPETQDFGWDSDEEAYARRYCKEEEQGGPGSTYDSDVDSN